MKNKCFLCETDLNSKNTTYEHIFLKSLDNDLGSRLMLCKNCNSLLGYLIDMVIPKNFDFFLKMDGDHGRKGKNQMNIETEINISGLCAKVLIKPDGTSTLKRPVISKNNKKGIFDINDEKSADKWIKSTKKKHPKSEVKKENHENNSDLPINLQIDLTEIFLEAMKISIEFSIYCGIKKENITMLPKFKIIIDRFKLLKKETNQKEAIDSFYKALKSAHLNIPITQKYPDSINKELRSNNSNIKAALYNCNNSIRFFVSFFNIAIFDFKISNNNKVKQPIIYLGDDKKFKDKYHDIILPE